ncbi:unnamed protein product, partial [Amoebophrya sp. A25]
GGARQKIDLPDSVVHTGTADPGNQTAAHSGTTIQLDNRLVNSLAIKGKDRNHGWIGVCGLQIFPNVASP